MATTQASTENAPIALRLSLALQRLNELSVLRQIGLMMGLAASVALGIAIIFWSQEEDFSLLYSDISEQEMAEITDVLDKSKIPYQLNDNMGSILIPSEHIRKARLSLAALGLPKTGTMGFEIMDKEQGFGTSHFVQSTQYHRALEGELSRSIMALQGVKKARVHLALPKQSVFVRQRKKPSASVMVELYTGYHLEEEQVGAIRHMVASSIPELDNKMVTVVDQMGRLLSKDKPESITLNDMQLTYTRKLEETYKQRISNILMPFLGENGFRAEVVADVDYSVTEQTQERYNPDLPALRSTQEVEENSRGQIIAGIPGALTNQPPGGSVAPEKATGEGTAQNKEPETSKRRSTRNYELDKTVTHTRLATGNVQRVSVAVIVDYKQTNSETGLASTPRTQEELDIITALVKKAVGFNVQRGDSVTVSNAAFTVAPLETLPELEFWETPWFMGLMKQLAGALVVLILIMTVLRPTFKNLTTTYVPGTETDEEEEARLALEQDSGDLLGLPGEVQADSLEAQELPPIDEYEELVAQARKLISDNPEIATQALREWMYADEEEKK